MWRELTAIAILGALLFGGICYLGTSAQRASGSLTAEREAFLRERIGYLEAQVRLERAACSQTRATHTAEDMARRLGLEVVP